MIAGSVRKSALWRACRLGLVLCSVLTGALLLSGAPALAALGGEPAHEAPTIDSESVTGVTEHGATLEGQIDPHKEQLDPLGVSKTTYFFEYGTTSSYGDSAPSIPAMTVGSEVELPIAWLYCPIPESTAGCKIRTPDPVRAVGVSLTGLEPGVTYHYRLVATNTWLRTELPPGVPGDEIPVATYGADATFTTASSLGGPSSNETETPSGGQPASGPMPPILTTVVLSKTPVTTTKSKAAGNALKLARALKACAKQTKRQRARCERHAHGKYASTAKDTGKKG